MHNCIYMIKTRRWHVTISCQPDGRPPQPVRPWKSGRGQQCSFGITHRRIQKVAKAHSINKISIVMIVGKFKIKRSRPKKLTRLNNITYAIRNLFTARVILRRSCDMAYSSPQLQHVFRSVRHFLPRDAVQAQTICCHAVSVPGLQQGV